MKNRHINIPGSLNLANTNLFSPKSPFSLDIIENNPFSPEIISSSDNNPFSPQIPFNQGITDSPLSSDTVDNNPFSPVIPFSPDNNPFSPEISFSPDNNPFSPKTPCSPDNNPVSPKTFIQGIDSPVSSESPSNPEMNSTITLSSDNKSEEKTAAKLSTETIQIDGADYIKVKDLAGRGQAAKAGFYKIPADKQIYLIKEDEPKICILESSCDFIIDLLPPSYCDAINLAECAIAYDKNNNATIVTKQKTVEGKPFDIAILNQKRNPKTLISVDYKNINEITFFIDLLPHVTKSYLATVLFGRRMLLDESLHIGQYMWDGIRLIGIDLGARGRYAHARKETNDFKHKTSKFYSESGQFKKDYFSYLSIDTDVKIKYMHLWAREFEIKEIVNKSILSFRKQLAIIPSDQITETLNGIFDIYTKKSTVKRNKRNVTQEELENMMSDVLHASITQMQQEAKEYIQYFLKDITISMQKRCGLDPHDIQTIQQLLISNSYQPNKTEKIIKKLNNWIEKMVNKKWTDSQKDYILNKSYQILAHLHAHIEFNFSDKTQLQTIELLQLKIKMLRKLLHYKLNKLHSIIFNNDAKTAKINSEISNIAHANQTIDITAIKDIIKPSKSLSLFSSQDLSLIKYLSKYAEKYNEQYEICSSQIATNNNSKNKLTY
ncbi:MAG: hypothetical protein JO131_02190 [Gammaproteobacteria bacterium]|nr:hypothetical protein [Gammaproteobacteria bacterium]